MLGIFKNYIDKRINLLKLETTDSVVKIASVVIYAFLLLVFGLSFFSFLFISIGLFLGDWLGNYAYGFLVVSVFFLLCLIIFLLAKKSLIKCFKEIVIKSVFEKK